MFSVQASFYHIVLCSEQVGAVYVQVQGQDRIDDARQGDRGGGGGCKARYIHPEVPSGDTQWQG